jgi:hypothetical protein
VTWSLQEENAVEEQDSFTADGIDPQVARIEVNNLGEPRPTPYGTLRFYPRMKKHDLSICAYEDQPPEMLSGPEKATALRQGHNTCWLDAMVTGMRMHGIGRLAYDAKDPEDPPTCTSLTLELLRADWTSFNTLEDVNKFRDPILASIATQSNIHAGSMASPADLWQFAARGIPSVSFGTMKKKLCTTCGEANYHQTPQDIEVNSIELFNSGKATLPELLNARFEEQTIQSHRVDFATCTKCSDHPALPLRQKTVVIDRPPHILCIGLPTGEKTRMPDLSDPKTILDGVNMKYENLEGEARSVVYKAAALVYTSGANHWAVAANVKYKRTRAAKLMQEGWLECDGLTGAIREVNGRTLNPKIKGGSVARILFKRVYTDCDEEMQLR